MDIDKLKAVVESLRTVEVKEVFPPVGDAHAITAAAVFPEAKDAFLGRKVMHRKRRVEVEGAEAKAYYKEELRATAKMIGLAIPYGGTGYTVASRLGVSQSEGDEIVSNILAGNPMVGRYIQARRSQVRREKKVASIFGRIRYLPDIDSKNNKKVYLSERLAFNAPVQMSGAEQLKLILLRVDRFCEEHRLNLVSGNLINTYRGWFTRVVGLVGQDRLQEVELELDKIESGNCKVVVFKDEGDLAGERVSFVFERNLRLTWADIKRLGLILVW